MTEPIEARVREFLRNRDNDMSGEDRYQLRDEFYGFHIEGSTFATKRTKGVDHEG